MGEQRHAPAWVLLHQARAAFAHWFGTTPEVTPALRAMVERRL